MKKNKTNQGAPKLKIGIFDIETAPNVGTYFNLYEEGNILWTIQHWYILSFALKDLHSKKTVCYALPDFKDTYKKDKTDDSKIVQKLWEMFNEYDVLIAHNGQAFDTKKVMARFIYHRLKPPKPCQFIDTKLVAKKYFKFDSNRLDDLADYMGIGHKLATEKGLWKKCLDGDMKSWGYMKKYNIQDVVLLEKVYLVMLPFITNHPNVGLMLGERIACPNCGSKRMTKSKNRPTRTGWKQQFQCQSCGSYHTSPMKPNSQIR